MVTKNKSNKTNSSKCFIVIGCRQTGSGTLTFPEEFDVKGVYDNDVSALDVVNELNSTVEMTECSCGCDDPDDCECDLEPECSDDMMYEVWDTEYFVSMTKKSKN